MPVTFRLLENVACGERGWVHGHGEMITTETALTSDMYETASAQSHSPLFTNFRSRWMTSNNFAVGQMRIAENFHILGSGKNTITCYRAHK